MEIPKDLENYLKKERKRIVDSAISKKIITREEWENRFKNYFDDYGINSFIHFLEAILYGKINTFITLNSRMIKEQDELEKRFGIKICSPSQFK